MGYESDQVPKSSCVTFQQANQWNEVEVGLTLGVNITR